MDEFMPSNSDSQIIQDANELLNELGLGPIGDLTDADVSDPSELDPAIEE